MKYFILAASLLFQLEANAKFSTSEIISKIERNSIAFDRAPKGGDITQATIERMIELQKSKFPNFKPAMWYDFSFAVGGIYYIVSYDWTANECNLTYNDMDELKSKGAQSQFKTINGAIVDIHKDHLPMKVCEKLYNFYSK